MPPGPGGMGMNNQMMGGMGHMTPQQQQGVDGSATGQNAEAMHGGRWRQGVSPLLDFFFLILCAHRPFHTLHAHVAMAMMWYQRQQMAGV